MFKKLSNEQLTKLALHTAAINGILLDALLAPQSKSPIEPECNITDIDIDIFVIDPNSESPFKEDEPEALNIDALCGDWKGGRKRPALKIFKAEPGYLAAFGKQPKKGEVGDCYLINEVKGKLCIKLPDGDIFLSHNTEKDVLTLFPGGEYTRTAGKE